MPRAGVPVIEQATALLRSEYAANETRFPRTRHATDTRQPADWDLTIDVLDVVNRRTLDRNLRVIHRNRQ